ncbi:MAG: hypothetical protein FWC92_07335 [Defluviitaleaceae bacterium]|nr:hypothetical protein [Defluviitaleaceae bacterium]
MKELTGALINNFYLMNTKLTRIYMLLLLLLTAMYFVTGSPQIGMYVPYAIILALPSASLENAITPFSTKWTAFENSWALAPHFMVISRYILYVLLVAAGLAVWAVLPLDYYYYLGLFSFVDVLVAGLLMCVTYYPIVYLLNPRQDSTGLIALFGSMFLAMTMAFGIHVLVGDSYVLKAVAVAATYVVSMALSVAFNAMHRGKVA